MENNKSLQTDNERLDREREFHNRRFADDALRRKHIGRFYESTKTIYERYKERVLHGADGARVLEYGVGTGSYAFALAEQGAFVTGIDISETAVAIAERESIRRGLRINFRAMNAEKTSFGDESFDIVCGTGILHHLDLRKAIPEIRRVLRRGGSGFFLEPMGHNVLINLFRRMTPRLRSADEHPLLEEDLRFMSSYFGRCRTEYFGLVSLVRTVAGPLRQNLRLRSLLEAIDRNLFTIPLLRRQAWIVVIELGDTHEVQAAPSQKEEVRVQALR